MSRKLMIQIIQVNNTGHILNMLNGMLVSWKYIMCAFDVIFLIKKEFCYFLSVNNFFTLWNFYKFLGKSIRLCCSLWLAQNLVRITIIIITSVEYTVKLNKNHQQRSTPSHTVTLFFLFPPFSSFLSSVSPISSLLCIIFSFLLKNR